MTRRTREWSFVTLDHPTFETRPGAGALWTLVIEPFLDLQNSQWLTSLMKDADGLDRVWLGDLDLSYLRNPEAREMVGFAGKLFSETNGKIPAWGGHLEAVWSEGVNVLDARRG